ncbi:tRNA epoxyqueuosine(34) reductase QueG [candidate division KSB1 bacterium]|nr:tRNA epoxyqueuosine(34) reductase QueG [candidate division KSB1 bacterium]
MNVENLKQSIEQKAMQLGFDRVGVARAGPVASAHLLRAYLELGYHGNMAYLARDVDLRTIPSLLLPDARSILMLAVNYYHPASGPGTELISRYARGDDYHTVLYAKLKQLLEFIKTTTPGCDGRCFVDSAPVMEKYWAEQAGIGWQGKHSLIISPPFGSWIFFGGIITTLELDPDQPMHDQCGDCRRCMDACPTGAIVRPYVVDARRCISYHTVELKADQAIPPEMAAAMGERIFGCDICQQVCPYNENNVATHEPAFKPREELLRMTMRDFTGLNEDVFKILTKNSALLRMKYDGMMRNLRAIQQAKSRQSR